MFPSSQPTTNSPSAAAGEAWHGAPSSWSQSCAPSSPVNTTLPSRVAKQSLSPKAKGAAIERRAFEAYSDSAERVLAPLSDEEIERINAALELLSAIFEAPGATEPAAEDITTSLATVRAALQETRSDPTREDRMEAK